MSRCKSQFTMRRRSVSENTSPNAGFLLVRAKAAVPPKFNQGFPLPMSGFYAFAGLVAHVWFLCFSRSSCPADAVAKRYRPWPKGLRADSLPWFDSPLVQGASRLRYTDKAQRTDSLPWFDSPLVQGASRLRYTDKAQVAATGPYWPKGARNKKNQQV